MHKYTCTLTDALCPIAVDRPAGATRLAICGAVQRTVSASLRHSVGACAGIS